MRIKLDRSLIVLAAVGASIGLVGGQTAAQAAPVIYRSVGSSAVTPANSTTEPLSVFGGCATWKGSLTAYTGSGKGYENYAEVAGTLTEKCGGVAALIFWTSCDGGTYDDETAWLAENDSKPTDFTAGPCSYGFSAYLELIWTGAAGYGVGYSDVVYS